MRLFVSITLVLFLSSCIGNPNGNLEGWKNIEKNEIDFYKDIANCLKQSEQRRVRSSKDDARGKSTDEIIHDAATFYVCMKSLGWNNNGNEGYPYNFRTGKFLEPNVYKLDLIVKQSLTVH